MKDNIILAIILARGGSKGVPGKNILPLNGKPVMLYTIDAAREAKSLDRIILSTEDEEIAQIGLEYGVEVIMRPHEYASDSSSIEMALRHTVIEVEKQGVFVRIIVPLYANVPIRKKGSIDEVVETLISTGADSVQTYAPYTTPPQWACKIENDRPKLLDEKYKFAFRRQLVETAYFPNAAAIAIKYDVLMKTDNASTPDSFMGTDKRAIIQKPEDTIDIDNPIDLLWAKFHLEWILKEKEKNNDEFDKYFNR